MKSTQLILVRICSSTEGRQEWKWKSLKWKSVSSLGLGQGEKLSPFKNVVETHGYGPIHRYVLYHNDP